MKLIYIAYGNVSVFDSQVVALLNHYVEFGKVSEITLIFGSDYKSEPNIKKLKNLDSRIKIKYYKQYPQYFFIENFTIASILKVLREIPHIEKHVIHVRNDVLAHYVYRAFSKLRIGTSRIIADVRGAGLEQLIEFSDKNEFILQLKKIQRKQVDRSLKNIKNISVVSESLKNYILDKLGNNVNVKINSCLSNKNFHFNVKERDLLRAQLNIKKNESLLVLSTGGDNAWQNTKEAIDLLAEKNFKILNLSRTEIHHANVINMFVPYEEMFKYLCAADAAIIWRRKGITNQVASPVKFSEYICCGLPVLTNESIDLITKYVNKYNCGKILNSLSSLEEDVVIDLKKINRMSISEQGRKNFGIETIANQYVEFYEAVL